jgi:hypothetical protein
VRKGKLWDEGEESSVSDNIATWAENWRAVPSRRKLSSAQGSVCTHTQDATQCNARPTMEQNKGKGNAMPNPPQSEDGRDEEVAVDKQAGQRWELKVRQPKRPREEVGQQMVGWAATQTLAGGRRCNHSNRRDERN